MIKDATERQRITMLRQLLKLSQTEFSRKINISQGALSQIESGRSRLSMETLKNLTRAFNVNCNWVVNGEGDIFLNKDTTKPKPDKKQGIPLIDVNARAGYIKGYNNIDYLDTLDTYEIPGFENEDNYRMFEIEGESMVPTLFPSEIVIARKKENLKNFKSDKLSVLLTKKDLIAKRAKESSATKNKIKIISDNPEYSNFNISQEDIVEAWEIKGKITKKLLQNYVFNFHRFTTMGQDIKNLQSKISDLINQQKSGADKKKK